MIKNLKKKFDPNYIVSMDYSASLDRALPGEVPEIKWRVLEAIAFDIFITDFNSLKDPPPELKGWECVEDDLTMTGFFETHRMLVYAKKAEKEDV